MRIAGLGLRKYQHTNQKSDVEASSRAWKLASDSHFKQVALEEPTPENPHSKRISFRAWDLLLSQFLQVGLGCS